MKKPSHLEYKPITAATVVASKCDAKLIAQINEMLRGPRQRRGAYASWRFDVTDVGAEQRLALQRAYRLAGWYVHEVTGVQRDDRDSLSDMIVFGL